MINFLPNYTLWLKAWYSQHFAHFKYGFNVYLAISFSLTGSDYSYIGPFKSKRGKSLGSRTSQVYNEMYNEQIIECFYSVLWDSIGKGHGCHVGVPNKRS